MNARRRHLFNPWLDFLGLGGASLIVLALFFLLYPEDDSARAVLAVTMLFPRPFREPPPFRPLLPAVL